RERSSLIAGVRSAVGVLGCATQAVETMAFVDVFGTGERPRPTSRSRSRDRRYGHRLQCRGMKIVVIGGSGHVGTFLVPRLVRAGHDVANISRGISTAYTKAREWEHVQQIIADRKQEDIEGTFGDRIAGFHADAVVDMVCFTLDSAVSLVNRLRGE